MLFSSEQTRAAKRGAPGADRKVCHFRVSHPITPVGLRTQSGGGFRLRVRTRRSTSSVERGWFDGDIEDADVRNVATEAPVFRVIIPEV